MGFFKNLKNVITFVPRRIDKKIEEEIGEKTQVAMISALQTLDQASPILTTLLAGGTVKVEMTIKLIDTDGPSIPGR